MFRNWQRALSEPVFYAKPELGKLLTLDDARRYIRGLPKAISRRPEWKSAAKELRAAAWNGRCEAATRQLQLALILHNALDSPPPLGPAPNDDKEWSDEDLRDLKNAFTYRLPMACTAHFLSRSVEKVASKAEELGLICPKSTYR